MQKGLLKYTYIVNLLDSDVGLGRNPIAFVRFDINHNKD